MLHKSLYLLAEGNDDTRFLKSIIQPIFERKYKTVFIRQHSKKSVKFIKGLITSIKENDDDYIYYNDINSNICITKKRNEILKVYPFIDSDKIIIVIKEIEGWYLAGLNESSSNVLKIKYLDHTDDVGKRKFSKIMPIRFTNKTDFMMEILKFYSLDAATVKNRSFSYFYKKYCRKVIL